MATATQANDTATPKAREFKGFALTCPRCNEDEPVIKIDLTTNDPGLCSCEACGADFYVADAIEEMAAKLAEWRKVARLVEMAAELSGE